MLLAVPVVFWLRVGKSAAMAMLGTPVLVVFFRMPVPRPAKDVPLILPTTVAPCVPVTSPAKLPVKEPAEPETLPVTLPVRLPEKVVAVNVPPPVMLLPPIAMAPDIVPPDRARSEEECPVTAPLKVVAVNVPVEGL